ncbi:MAG: anaerobic ribonucleoside-triphosphate reductase [Alphaproteobacteria bacterium]
MTDYTLGNESEIRLNDAERQPCEIWTRVMGYFRPVSEFNIGKKSEYAERKYFSEKKAINPQEAAE